MALVICSFVCISAKKCNLFTMNASCQFILLMTVQSWMAGQESVTDTLCLILLLSRTLKVKKGKPYIACTFQSKKHVFTKAPYIPQVLYKGSAKHILVWLFFGQTLGENLFEMTKIKCRSVSIYSIKPILYRNICLQSSLLTEWSAFRNKLLLMTHNHNQSATFMKTKAC